MTLGISKCYPNILQFLELSSLFSKNANHGDNEGSGAPQLAEAKDDMKSAIADPVESADTAKEVDDFTKDITRGVIAELVAHL